MNLGLFPLKRGGVLFSQIISESDQKIILDFLREKKYLGMWKCKTDLNNFFYLSESQNRGKGGGHKFLKKSQICLFFSSSDGTPNFSVSIVETTI